MNSTKVDSIFFRAVLLGLAYWLTVVLATELVSPVDNIALLWPPNALAAAALIFSRRRHWPLYLTAMAFAYFSARIPSGPLPIYVYFGFCTASIFEVLIVAELVKRFIPSPITHESLSRVLQVVILAAFPATVVSAIIGGVFITSAIEKATFLNVSTGWLTAGLSGLLLVLPVLLAWFAPNAPSIKSYNKSQIIEHTAIAAAFVVIGVLTSVILAGGSQISLFFPYLVFPVLIWTAIRTGLRSTTVATLAVGLFAIAMTYMGQGPFYVGGFSAFGQVVLMKVGLITITATTILLAAVVTDREHARKTLRESKSRLGAILESSPSSVVIRDLEGHNLIANNTFCEWFAITREEIIGKSMFDYLPPDISDEIAAHERTVLETKKTLTTERRVTFPDGITRDVFNQRFPVFDSNGECDAIGSVATDITEHKLMEKQLLEIESTKENEERLRKIFETSPAGIAIISLETNKRLYLNPAMAKLFGASSVDQLFAMNLKQTYANPRDLDWLRSKTGDDFIEETEIERLRLDGSKWWCLLNRRHIEYEGQEALLAWHYDITERKRAEEEIKKLNEGLEQRIEERTRELSNEIAERKQLEIARERLAHAVEAVPVGIALFDSDDRLVFSNSRYGELMEVMADIIKPGVTFEEMIRTMVERQPVLDAIGREEDYIRERVDNHRNPKGPVDIRRNNLSLMANETRLTDGSIFTIITDITEQKQAEEDRRLALVDAERANQAKSEFLATMSHEFRTPLNAILGFSDILSHQYFGPPGEGVYREYAKDIHSSGEHLLELVNDILDISTIEAGKQSLNKELLAVHEMIAESFSALAQKAQEKGIKLASKVPEDINPLYADRRATRQILLNLLSNAVKFTPEGGKITMSANDSKQETTIKIADTGEGIPEDKLPNLTEPFVRGEQDPFKPVEGWGLGLSITNSLVDLHDGQLDIQSTVGKGTTVTVTLPNDPS